MVIRPFSSAVIGMSYIGGFKNHFFHRPNFWSQLIDNPFNDGFWAKISIFLFSLTKWETNLKRSGPDVASSYFLKENLCCTWITRFPLVQTIAVKPMTRQMQSHVSPSCRHSICTESWPIYFLYGPLDINFVLYGPLDIWKQLGEFNSTDSHCSGSGRSPGWR